MTEPTDDKLPRGPQCPSDLMLDRHHTGELNDRARREVDQHVARCADCAARMEQRAQGFAAFGMSEQAMLARMRLRLEQESSTPSGSGRPSSAEVQTKPWWKGFRFGWAPALAAIGLFVVVARPWMPGDDLPPDDTVRVKGSARLQVFRERDGHIDSVVSGASFQAGDRLRFKVTLDKDAHVLLIGQEADGSLYPAAVSNEANSIPLSAGIQLLDHTVQLDASTGQEWIHAVVCTDPFSVSKVRADDSGELVAPQGCTVTQFEMLKERDDAP